VAFHIGGGSVYMYVFTNKNTISNLINAITESALYILGDM